MLGIWTTVVDMAHLGNESEENGSHSDKNEFHEEPPWGYEHSGVFPMSHLKLCSRFTFFRQEG